MCSRSICFLGSRGSPDSHNSPSTDDCRGSARQLPSTPRHGSWTLVCVLREQSELFPGMYSNSGTKYFTLLVVNELSVWKNVQQIKSY